MSRGLVLMAAVVEVLLGILSIGEIFKEGSVEKSTGTTRRMEHAFVVPPTSDMTLTLAYSLGDETHQKRTEEGGVKRHAVYRVSRLAT